MPASVIAPAPPIASYRDAAGQAYLTQDALQFPRNVLPAMVKDNPDQARFLSIVSFFGQSKGPVVTHPYEFEWYRQRELPWSIVVGAAVAAGSTTVTVTAGHGLRCYKGQQLRNTRTGEVIRASFTEADITTSSLANVVRSVGATADQAMRAGDILVPIGAARTEASSDPQPIGFKPELTSNYTSELAASAGSTHKIKTSDQYAGWGPDADQKLVGDFFRMQVENHLLFSEQEYGTGPDGYPITNTAGLMSVMTTNVQTLSSTPDWAQFINIIYPYIKYGQGGIYGRNVKHAFVSRSVQNWINTLPTQHVVVNDPHKGNSDGIEWGWYLNSLRIGKFKLILHEMPHWDEWSGGALNMAQAMVIVDANHIGVRLRKEGAIGLLPARGPNGRAANNVTYDQVCWHFDGGLQYDLETAHGALYFPTV